jgi:ABC-2 type transport system ATP-binding protein
MSAIAIEHLTKHYAGGRGVTDVSLSIDEGEVYGFIGPNGAGKSTTIRTMLGLLAPTSGSVRLFGESIADAFPALRARIGYLPSEPHLYEGMRVGELLDYAGHFFARDTKVRRAELVRALELDVTRATDDLSLGNKKKVALVMALQHEPSLLVLDEPTSGLDPLIQQRLYELIADEKRRGTTVFFSSHVLSEVERLCDRVTILRDGRVVETARVDAMQSRGVKRVRVVPSEGNDLPATRALEGVTAPVVDGSHVSLTYRGPIPALLAALAADRVKDVSIGEPSLEEIVLSQYGASPSSSSARPT